MWMPCAVSGCSSSRDPERTFYRITKNKKLLAAWQQAVNLNITEYSRICSLHFKPNDFVYGKTERELKPNAVPSIGVTDMVIDNNQSGEDFSSDDEDDNMPLKELLANGRNFVSAQQIVDAHEQFEMTSSKCNLAHCNATEMKHVGILADRKTKREEAMQTKVKVLGMRLKRREERISYMNTVFRMIKNLVKGSDMEYKLCCELQKISDLSEISKSDKKIKKGKRLEKAETQDIDNDKNSDEWESGDDLGTCVEVVFSSNLNSRDSVR